MTRFNRQNVKKNDPRWFLNETVEKTKLEQLEVLTEQQVLKRGMRETDPNGPIHQLQKSLKKLNLYAGEPDGVYGGGTKKAVLDFQKAQIDAGNLPAKNKRGRSNADGVVGPTTKSLLTQAITTYDNIGKPTPSPATKKAKPQSKKAAMANAIAARLQSDLSGYVDEDEMKNVVKILKVADNMGILSAVSQKYLSLTGDGLQATIRGVSGVNEPKNQALTLLGGKKAEKGIHQVVSDKIKNFLSGLFGGSKAQQVKKLSQSAKRNSYLLFDGDYLNWVSDGKVQVKWPATSGKVWFVSPGKRDQAAKSFGPIPESRYKTGGLQSMKRNVGDPSLAMQAEYLIREMISTYLPNSGVTPAPHGWSEKKGDSGIFSKIAWGNYRIKILGSALGRGGFYIHGGSLRGSSGCIDLGDGMDEFAKFWTVNTISKGRGPRLVVDYQGKEEKPDTSADKVARAKKKNIKNVA